MYKAAFINHRKNYPIITGIIKEEYAALLSLYPNLDTGGREPKETDIRTYIQDHTYLLIVQSPSIVNVSILAHSEVERFPGQSESNKTLVL